MAKPVICWRGGKGRMVKTLLPLIPKHHCYCEPFAGGLALLMAKPRSRVEVVNDLNGDLVALYLSIQYHLPELHRELNNILSSRQLLRTFVEQPGITEIQRAARFYFKNKASFAANMGSFAVSKDRSITFHPGRAIDYLGKARERLHGVAIENLPYERVLQLYDGPKTFFFLDPPYLNSEINAYDCFTEEDMRTLRRRIDKLEGGWLLTLDDSDFNRELFRGFKIRGFESRNQAAHQKRGAKFREIIITASGSEAG